MAVCVSCEETLPEVMEVLMVWWTRTDGMGSRGKVDVLMVVTSEKYFFITLAWLLC